MLPRIYGENLFDDIFDNGFFTGRDPLFGKQKPHEDRCP